MESREDCLHEAAEFDRLAELANTRAAHALLAAAAFQRRKLAERAAERRKPSWPLVAEAVRRTSAQAESGKGPGTHQKSDFDSAGQRPRFADSGASERLFQALQHSGIAMETLACIDVFDLNNPGAPPARGVDSMHAEPAIANEPRHH